MSNNPSSISIGKRVPKTLKHKHGWQKAASIKGNEICVVYFGGGESNSHKVVNGYAKMIREEILESMREKDIPVYGVIYEFHDFRKSVGRHLAFVNKHMELSRDAVKNMKGMALFEEESPKYIEDLYRKIIEPRISSNIGEKRLDAEEACKRLGKLNIIAHCYGGYTAFKLEELMWQKMKDLRYSRQEATKIQERLLVVAHTLSSPMRVNKSTFVSFFLHMILLFFKLIIILPAISVCA